MNKSYKIVYSKARKRCVVVSEIARAFAGRVQASRIASVSALMASLGAVALAGAMPAGARDIPGSGTVDAKGNLTITGDFDGDGEVDSITISGVGFGVLKPTQGPEAKKDKDGNVVLGADGKPIYEIKDGFALRSANADANVGHNATALGMEARASGQDSIALGTRAKALAQDSIAIGTRAQVGAWGSIAAGYEALATNANSIAFGDSSKATGGHSNAVGSCAEAVDWANAFGFEAQAKASGAVAVGNQTRVREAAKNSVALGNYAEAWAESSFALGTTSIADEANTLSVGKSAASGRGEYKRRIVNVADGTKATDAATVGQLQTVSKKADEKYLNLNSTKDGTTGITNNELSINASDTIASGTTALATVKAIYDEVRPTADGTYVKTAQTTAENLAALDKQVSDNSSLLGYLSVNAADDALTAAPSTSAKATGAHSLALGEGAAASEENALALGSNSVANEKNTVSVGSAATGLTRRIVNVASGTKATDAATVAQTATVESSSGLLTVNGDEANSNGSKRYKLSLKTGDLSEGSAEGLVTNTTVKTALQGYAKADASNIASGSANQAAWLSALGTESVASGSKLFITSGALYKEVRVEANGNYVRAGNTAAQNLAALDDQAKKNADAASKAQTTAESAVDKAKKAQTTAEEAKTAAKKAQTTAETAKTDADKAQATAEKAEGKADKAQTTAEKAEAKADKAQATAEKAEAKADKAQATAEKAEAKADKAQATAEKAEAKADKAQATAEKAEAKADKAQATAEKAEAKADKAQATAEKAEAKADKAQTTAEKAETKADKAQTTAEQAKDAAKKAQSTAEKVDGKAAKAQATAEKAQNRANDAMAEARKHTKVSASGGLQVTRTDGENGATYDVSIAEDADFTAKQTTWKGEDGKFSTANSSGFFSGGASAENADAYMSKGVVSAGTDVEKKIVLDGNTGKATFGKTVTIDGTSGKISGVAAGEVSETSTDAVNGAQLYEVQQGVAQNAEGIESLGRAVNKVDRKIDRTGALAAALAGLHPQDYDEDHPVSGAVGIGHYKGKQALAVGMFVRPVENFMVSLGASGSSDDYMLNAGASFRFGGPTLKKSPQQMMAKLSDQEVTIRDLSAQNLAQKTRLESQDEKLAQQASEIKSQKVTLDAQNAKIDAQKAQLESQNAKLESQDARLERQAAEIEQLKAMMAKIQAKLGK